jgi:DNA-3-methyladenine glycosylase II
MIRWFLSLHSPLPQHGYSLSPEKVAATAAVSGAAASAKNAKGNGGDDDVLPNLSSNDPQTQQTNKDAGEGREEQATVPRAVSPDTSSVLPAPESTAVAATAVPPLATPKKKSTLDDTNNKKKTKKASEFTPALPTYTPSVDHILAGAGKKKALQSASESLPPPPLPEGLTVSVLKTRLGGTKVKYAISILFYFTVTLASSLMYGFIYLLRGALLTPAEMIALTESWRPYRSLGKSF